ncbi:hypothetical protein Tco_0464260 [Tanacetum coccineum]
MDERKSFFSANQVAAKIDGGQGRGGNKGSQDCMGRAIVTFGESKRKRARIQTLSDVRHLEPSECRDEKTRRKDEGKLRVLKAKEKEQEEIVVVRYFPEVFPDDLSGLPPVREMEFQMSNRFGSARLVGSPSDPNNHCKYWGGTPSDPNNRATNNIHIAV